MRNESVWANFLLEPVTASKSAIPFPPSPHLNCFPSSYGGGEERGRKLICYQGKKHKKLRSNNIKRGATRPYQCRIPAPPFTKRGCNAWWIQRRSYIKASHEDLKHDFLRISEALVALTFLPVLSPSTAVNRNEPNVSPLQLLPPMPVEQ